MNPSPFVLGIELIDDPGWMGGTLYLRNLALCLARLHKVERPDIRLLGSPATVRAFVAEHPGIFPPEAASAQTPWRCWLSKFGWSAASGGGRIDVVYPGFGAAIPGATIVRWIPDFQHRHLPHLFSNEEITARDRSIGAIAEKPGIVVLSSKVAADDFSRFFPGHVATPRVWHFRSLLDLTDEAEKTVFGVCRAHDLPHKYLYLPNQFWVHKNHITVLRALALLRKREGLKIPLVCTGAQSDRRNANHFENLQVFIRDSGIADQVHLLGLLPRGQQIAVLRGAAAVVQPSLFEGWSTVVEDVRATGRPILLSAIPVHQEQAPPRAFYFTPESVEELATILSREWPRLGHGPDPIAEGIARSDVEKLVIESAYTFCNIARSAIAAGSLAQ